MAQQERLIDDAAPQNEMDEAKKAEYRERLRQYLQDPAFRQIEGFPSGEDEDILALSDPPYYTACPNPFLPEIIEQWQAERVQTRRELGLPVGDEEAYHREPFATDVSEGKNHAIYRAHSYHTKVPHRAIMHYILHYTDPGDVIFDGFCGTGMTGVAAQLCDDKKEIQNLGYQVNDNGCVFDGVREVSKLGKRYAVISDLAPIGSFIAYNLNYPLGVEQTSQAYNQLLLQLDDIEHRYYRSFDGNGEQNGLINYVVWSDIYICDNCLTEYDYWSVAVEMGKGIARKKYPCPNCGAEQNTRNLERAYDISFDYLLQKQIRIFKQRPVHVSYISTNKRNRRGWNDYDDQYLEEINHEQENAFPIVLLPKGDRWKRDAFAHKGVNHWHHFYTYRAVKVLSEILGVIKSNTFSHRDKNRLLFLFTSFADRNATKRNRFILNKYNPIGRVNGPMANTLYLPNLFCEMNLIRLMDKKYKQILASSEISVHHLTSNVMISTNSITSAAQLTANSIDYIFTDPPFGHNIQYAELNLGLESFLGVQTSSQEDIVVNKVMGKSLLIYTQQMCNAMRVYYYALKPGRWITIEFHNSKASVWHSIQEAIARAGFVIAHVAILDKKQKTVHQDTNIGGAVNQDLAISAYKPHKEFEQQFLGEAGTEDGAWHFIQQHLAKLPVVIQEKGIIETLSERQDFLLFDRMVAFHIQRRTSVPLSAHEFYAGLRERFIERDGMFFLSEQTPEYDKARLQAQEVAQLTLFVTDEKSSIQWLRQQLAPDLGGHSQPYQDIQPKFLKQLHQLKHEALPELGDILEQNFLQDEEGRWYVPDPNKASDLEKLRQKALLREFDGYMKSKKTLRTFRTEAVRAGFAQAWRRQEYTIIVQIAERLPTKILQEDPDLLMYYDNASLMVGQ